MDEEGGEDTGGDEEPTGDTEDPTKEEGDSNE